MQPLVSICCTAYNHEKYIAQALDSFLAQKCDFPFEILVHDDVSTDRTADIIREYAAKYPEIIKPMFQTENQYSKGVPINETFNFPRAQGKYIALCECDDFWCDDTKLARQIAHMEADPECTFSFTNGYVYDANGIKIVCKGLKQDMIWDGTVVFFMENNSGKPITVYAEEVSVNGFMQDVGLWSDLRDGTVIIDGMSLLDLSDLELESIDEVEDIEFSLRIINSDNWDTIASTDPISLTF